MYRVWKNWSEFKFCLLPGLCAQSVGAEVLAHRWQHRRKGLWSKAKGTMKRQWRDEEDEMKMKWRWNEDEMKMKWRWHEDDMKMTWRWNEDEMKMKWRWNEDETKMKSRFKSWFPHVRTWSALVCAWEILRVQDLRLGWLFGVLIILSMFLCTITIIWLDILRCNYMTSTNSVWLQLLIPAWHDHCVPKAQHFQVFLCDERQKMNVAAAAFKHAIEFAG